MNFKRIGRYLFSLIVAVIVLALILPLAGIPQSHFLPPSLVYAKAQGLVSGKVTGKRAEQTNNWFDIGAHNYYVDYTFLARPVANTPSLIPSTQSAAPSKTKVPAQSYNGEVSVDQVAYQNTNVGDRVSVQYEKTYPWVNGVVNPSYGLGIGEGSNILSGWLLWAGAAIVLAGIFMSIIEYFWVREDI